MNTTKIYSVLMVMAIVLSVVGLTYSAWTDTIYIEGNVKMAHVMMTIISEKVLTSKEYPKPIYEVSEDGHLLTLNCSGLRECWYVWIGLVLQNQGSVPANVKPPQYIFEGPDNFVQYFETEEYFYGPYPENTGFGTREVWGKVKVGEHLLANGSVDFPDTEPLPDEIPFPTDPGEKFIIWIWIHVCDEPPDAQGKTVKLYIHILDDIAL